MMLSPNALPLWPTQPFTLRQLLGVDPGSSFNCHGQTQKNERCKKHVSLKSSTHMSSLLDQIIKCECFESSGTLLGEVSELIMCSIHRGKQSPAWFKTWEVKMRLLGPSVKLEGDENIPTLAGLPKKSTTAALSPQVKTEAGVLDTSIKSEEGIHAGISANSKNTKPKPPNPFMSRQPTQHKFEKFGNSLSTVAINRRIKDIISRDLLETEQSSDGSIYMYTFPNNYHDRSPYLKIGHTKDLNKRMISWENKCGYKPKVLVDFRADLYVKVERLVHATLRNERVREPSCPGCGKKHVEWFNVRSSKASSAIAVWTSWTRQEPYNDDGSLKQVWANRLKRVDLSDPRCWHDFVDGNLDEDDSSEGSDLDSFADIGLLSSSEDGF